MSTIEEGKSLCGSFSEGKDPQGEITAKAEKHGAL